MKNFTTSIAIVAALGIALQGAAQEHVGPATFEDLGLAPESHWRGDEAGENYESTFYSGAFMFDNYLWAEYDFWGKFAYSNETSTVYETLDDQFHSAVGHGANGSATYGVGYWADSMFGPGTTCFYSVNSEGDSISGCYITNNAWAYDAVINGDGYTDGGFTTGDEFYLTATGTRADGTTASVDFHLADYRSDNAANHYCLNTWEWVDLRSLGKVTKVSFAMNSTRSNSWGITTPTYFCIDDVDGERPVEVVEEIMVKQEHFEMNLAEYFTFTDPEATIEYSIVDEYDTNIATATVEGGILTLNSTADGQLSLVVMAVQKGHRQFVEFPIDVQASDAVKGTFAQAARVFPVPATTHVNVSLPAAATYTVQLMGIDGSLLWNKAGLNGNTVVPVEQLTPGIYLLRIDDGNSVEVKRIVKK